MSNETFESVFGKAERERIDKKLAQNRRIEIKENWDKLWLEIMNVKRRDGYFNVLLKGGTIIYNCKQFYHEVEQGHVFLECYDENDEIIAIIPIIDIEKIL